MRDQTREALRTARVAVENGRKGDLAVALGALINATERLLSAMESVVPGGVGVPEGHESMQQDAASDPAPYFDERR